VVCGIRNHVEVTFRRASTTHPKALWKRILVCYSTTHLELGWILVQQIIQHRSTKGKEGRAGAFSGLKIHRKCHCNKNVLFKFLADGSVSQAQDTVTQVSYPNLINNLTCDWRRPRPIATSAAYCTLSPLVQSVNHKKGGKTSVITTLKNLDGF